MEDNEIVKALESEIHLSEYVDSEYCDAVNVSLIQSAIDLINRLQAQNKDLAETVHNLTIEKDTLFDKAEELKAEVERLEKEKDEYAYLYDKHINTAFSHIKSEAYKEFAERLKKKYKPYVILGSGVAEIEIDNLIKEMVGEDK